jgi:hypothetical protein
MRHAEPDPIFLRKKRPCSLSEEKEDTMNSLLSAKKLGLGLITFFLANATRLWAEDAVREDNSDIFVWIFLAFCALIIVAQLIPALLMMLGFAKGMKKKTEPSGAEPVDDPTPPKV